MASIITQSDSDWPDPYEEGLEYVSLIDALESPGTLVLVTPGGFGSTPPANGGTVTNRFRDQAATLIGATPSDADLSVWSLGASLGVLQEITPKGGLHVGIPVSATGNAGMDLNMKAPLYNYLRTSGHEFYFSAHFFRTRLALTAPGTPGNGSALMSVNAGVTQLASGQLVGMGSVPVMPSPPAIVGKQRGVTTNVLGPVLADAAVKNTSAALTGAVAYDSQNATLWNMGPRNYNAQNSRRGAQGATILYRLVVEDLTVSGRTWEQVDKIDQAIYAREFGTGGTLLADTYTAAP
ncbi:hypothetical protein GRS96_12295 [Rathayibacter sp. VKM Ac-2803]|uniref:hypothetical protein n=1 Tax=Rathayibacter sp. VKM Ac-2803 TaxID=2609256 RepID=UPI00135B36D3|nr:hypothetical protein [Rathayibacter sp. VKM Ac-2803]MWV50049.1 hypothetical protein [Rathayibacter sp. VKM Ac-2803]